MTFRYFERLLSIALLLGGGVWLLASGWTRVRTHHRLDQNASVIEGRVLDATTRQLSSKGGQSSMLVVEYHPANHAPITREFDVDGDTYRAGLATGKATVTYLPGEPRISRITRFAALPYLVLAGLGGMMLIGGVFCIRDFFKKRPRPVSP